ncbi:helix-turn-helix transcriptional regulator [Sphingomonas sp. Y38-1Y]|uniref:helix-turn-helix transcriptional regulator n=1 Tax=Sphingomonas sp. Y38-1Y TaxID=3078265 RepID=UPI0028E6BBB0|nr:helix-turn-helix transcriptional regulator [Sphingomonas sp. Y38-1Y]
MPGGETSGTPKLTPRQHDCMRLAIKGQTNKEIAHHLGLSIKTVDGYIDGAKVGLGVAYRKEAVAKYHETFGNVAPGEKIPVVAAAGHPVAPPLQPAVEMPVGRGLERLSKLQRLGIIFLISLALTASLALAATTAVRWIAIYDASNPPGQTGSGR